MRSFLSVVFICFFVNVVGQNDTAHAVSIKFGLQRNSVLNQDSSRSHYTPKIGLELNKQLNGRLFLQLNALYNIKGYAHTETSNKYYYHFIDFSPRLSFKVVSDFYILAGGRLSYLTMLQKGSLSGNSSSGLSYESQSFSESFDYGWGVGATTLLHPKVWFSIIYEKSIPDKNQPVHSNLSFSISYRIGSV